MRFRWISLLVAVMMITMGFSTVTGFADDENTLSQQTASPSLETIADEKGKDVRTTIMMDKQELQDYINKLNEYYEVSYYEIARLDDPKKGYQKKYLTIDEINENGEKLFKLVELITDDKKFPQKKANRIVGAIRVKEREKVS